MGKRGKGGGGRRGFMKGAVRGDQGDSDDDADPVAAFREAPPPRQQNANAGMLPPNSDSEEEAEAPGEAAGAAKAEAEAEADDDGSSDDDGAGPPAPLPPQQGGGGRRAKDAPDAGQVMDDMARLALVRRRREEQRLQRIADEGFDRYLPPGTPGGPPAGWSG